MKSVSTFLAIVASIFLFLRDAHGQYFQDPTLTYQNITFDQANRSSYNASDCFEDLINCWENVRPDMLCGFFRFYASICTVVREYCAENWGDQDGYDQMWNMREQHCSSEGWYAYT